MVRLITQELESVDKKVREVLREPPILEAFGQRKVASGKKEHKFLGACDMPDIFEGSDFHYDNRNYPARETTGALLTYLTYPIKIKRTDIDASASANIETLLETAEIEGHNAMMKRIEEKVLFGSDKRGSKGMCNYSGKLKYGSDGNKTLTTIGNIFTQVEGAISAVRSHHIMPPYKCLITPGIMSEMRGNWISGFMISEYMQFKKTYLEGNQPIIDEIIETDAICTDSSEKKATLSASNQGLIICKMGEPHNYIAQSYDIHRDLIPGEFESDVDYALLWAGGFIPYEANSVCQVTGLTTTTAY